VETSVLDSNHPYKPLGLVYWKPSKKKGFDDAKYQGARGQSDHEHEYGCRREHGTSSKEAAAVAKMRNVTHVVVQF
jgi:hypothetical protein